MRVARALLASLVILATLALIIRGVLPRIGCNLEKGRINREVRRFARSGDREARLAQARHNVAVCRRCLVAYPEDVQLHILMGGNLRILEDSAGALESFGRALAIAERPEIYAQMAELELERGNLEAARARMRQAALFDINYLDVIDQPLRGEIEREVLARHERLRAAHR